MKPNSITSNIAYLGKTPATLTILLRDGNKMRRLLESVVD